MKIYITAQAMQKHEMETRLAVQMSGIIEHFLKIYLLPGHSAVKHWCSEVYAGIHIIEKLKQSNKYPSAEVLFSWTYEKTEDLITDKNWMKKVIKGICQQCHVENSFDNDIDEIIPDFSRKCRDYFVWLCDMLSQNGYVLPDDVFDEIGIIFLK